MTTLARPNVPRAPELPPSATAPSGPEEIVRLANRVPRNTNPPTLPRHLPKPKPRPRPGLRPQPPANDGRAATKGVTLRLSLSPYSRPRICLLGQAGELPVDPGT
jgi:hypothetical protein